MHFLTSVFGPGEEEVWRQFADEVGAEFLKGGFFGRPKVLARTREWTITFDTYSVTRGGGSEGGSVTYHYTRVRAPFRSMDGFRFRACRKTVLSGLTAVFGGVGKLFEMQDIETGHPEFDRDFSIKGNSEFKARALFANEQIRQLIQSEASVLLQVQHPWRLLGRRLPKGVDELYLEAPGRLAEEEDLYVHTPTGATRIDPRDVGRLEGIDWETQRQLRSLTSHEGRKSLAVERLKTLYQLFTETLNQLWHLGCASPITLQGSKP